MVAPFDIAKVQVHKAKQGLSWSWRRSGTREQRRGEGLPIILKDGGWGEGEGRRECDTVEWKLAKQTERVEWEGGGREPPNPSHKELTENNTGPICSFWGRRVPLVQGSTLNLKSKFFIYCVSLLRVHTMRYAFLFFSVLFKFCIVAQCSMLVVVSLRTIYILHYFCIWVPYRIKFSILM